MFSCEDVNNYDLRSHRKLTTSHPVKSTQQSVSLQRSPNTNERATQTEKYTSDAAVQWPADAYQLITTDHVYAANCENELKKKLLQEDSQSLDLFLLDDDFISEGSQPQYRQSDPNINSSAFTEPPGIACFN